MNFTFLLNRNKKIIKNNNYNLVKFLYVMILEQRILNHAFGNRCKWNRVLINKTACPARWGPSTEWPRTKDEVTHTNFLWEFDPGSGLTLAACITHASRTMKPNWSLRSEIRWISGGRVSNAWVTCLREGDSLWKRRIIPYETNTSHEVLVKDLSL